MKHRENRYILIISCLIFLFPAIIYVWKYMPPSWSPLMEILAMNQTFRLAAGLFFITVGFILLYRNSKYMVFTGAAVIISVLIIVDSVGKHCSGDCEICLNDRDFFTLYSQNVLYSGANSEEIPEIVLLLSPDIVLFQEMDLPRMEVVRDELERLGYEYVINDLYPPSEEAFSTSVYSRFPLRNHWIMLSEGPGWKPDWPTQFFEFSFQGEWIKIANLHLVPPNLPLSEKEYNINPEQDRMARAQLEEIIQAISKEEGASIICGDFNQTPTSKHLRMLESTWYDGWCAVGDGLGFTFPNPIPLFRIDYIFLTMDLHILSLERIENDFSDHLGLYAKISLTQE